MNVMVLFKVFNLSTCTAAVHVPVPPPNHPRVSREAFTQVSNEEESFGSISIAVKDNA